MAKPRDALRSRILARRSAFRTEYLDFDRGIRMGHLEPDERITQILKARLAERHGIRFVCDRWGRGVHWQWICWVPEPNRNAKPLSGKYNFGSTKFFTAIDRDERTFDCGMQLERAPLRPPPGEWPLKLEADWDWHVLLRELRAERLGRVLRRLLRDGFSIHAGAYPTLERSRARKFDPAALARALKAIPASDWGAFQLLWSMPEKEVRATSGADLIDAVVAVFDEVAPAMNLCMYAPCLKPGGGDR